MNLPKTLKITLLAPDRNNEESIRFEGVFHLYFEGMLEDVEENY
jgi:hypothetical protein